MNFFKFILSFFDNIVRDQNQKRTQNDKNNSENSSLDSKGEGNGHVETDFNADDVVTRMLRNINAKWEVNTGDSGVSYYHFQFQRGFFHMMPSGDRHLAYIHFLNFMDCPFGQLDNVRDACNRFNQRYPDMKVFYSIDAERHKIRMHLATSLRLMIWSEVLERDFADTLMLCFEASRYFALTYDKIVESDVNNLEERISLTKREQYLAHETEMKLQAGSWHIYDTQRIVLKDALAMILHAKEIVYETLTITTEELSTIDNPQTIENLDIGALLVDMESETPRFIRQQATLVLQVKIGNKRQTLLLHIGAESEAEGVLYMRLTFVQPERILSMSHSMEKRDADNSQSLTFVMSYAPACDKEKQAEFDYLWQEMQNKQQRGEELSDELRFMSICQHPDTGFHLYWGRRLFLAKRYYEALCHLENAYYPLRKQYHDLQRQERRLFFELSYYIGMCFLHLAMPERAYFYLDGLFNRNNLRFTQGYINALVASHDYRALEVVESILKNLQRLNKDNDTGEITDEARAELDRFMLFLRRAKGRVLLDNLKLDAAEEELRKLLPEDKRHEQYLLEQLAYIDLLRAEKLSSSRLDTLSVSTEFPKPEN